MKRIIFLILAVVLVGFAAIARAGRDEGVAAAYEKGDYATAYKEFKSLAVQGDSKAQYDHGYADVQFNITNIHEVSPEEAAVADMLANKFGPICSRQCGQVPILHYGTCYQACLAIIYVRCPRMVVGQLSITRCFVRDSGEGRVVASCR